MVYREGLLGSVILGASKVNPDQFSEFLNGYAKEGWRVVAMSPEQRREMLIFKRESQVLVLERERA